MKFDFSELSPLARRTRYVDMYRVSGEYVIMEIFDPVEYLFAGIADDEVVTTLVR